MRRFLYMIKIHLLTLPKISDPSTGRFKKLEKVTSRYMLRLFDWRRRSFNAKKFRLHATRLFLKMFKDFEVQMIIALILHVIETS